MIGGYVNAKARARPSKKKKKKSILWFHAPIAWDSHNLPSGTRPSLAYAPPTFGTLSSLLHPLLSLFLLLYYFFVFNLFLFSYVFLLFFFFLKHFPPSRHFFFYSLNVYLFCPNFSASFISQLFFWLISYFSVFFVFVFCLSRYFFLLFLLLRHRLFFILFFSSFFFFMTLSWLLFFCSSFFLFFKFYF